MRRAMNVLAALAAASSLVAAGCGGVAEPGGTVPDSASLAPADALAYATVTTDQSSDQWKQAQHLLERFPGGRDQLSKLAESLGGQGLTWEHDVAPALGPEVVLVVTAAKKEIVLVKPDDETRLTALLEKSGQPVARSSVDGWVALAEDQADLDAYRASLARGSLATDDALASGFAALPEDALARVWVDVAALAPQLIPKSAGQTSPSLDLGLDWLSAAVAAEQHGVKLVVGTHVPGGNGTEYEPDLFQHVPASAVAALSFGGTQKLVDQLERRIPLGDIANQVEKVTGVSVGGILDAFSGEGLVYVRPGDPAPEVTLVLAPPDADAVWATVDTLAHTLADRFGTTVKTVTEGGREVHVVDADGQTMRYTRLDGGTVIVTTASNGIADYTGDGAKLVSSDQFRRAADEVGLGDRTGGFLYVDLDGLLPLIEGISGGTLPADVRTQVEQLDSFILQASGDDGGTTSLSGFLRLND
jgi:YD repeat-containing protein